MADKTDIRKIEVITQTKVMGKVCSVGEYDIPADYPRDQARALIVAGKAKDITSPATPRQAIPDPVDDLMDDRQTEFLNAFKGLNKDKYREFVEHNIDEFRKTSIENLDKARDKWDRFYPGESFPDLDE